MSSIYAGETYKVGIQKSLEKGQFESMPELIPFCFPYLIRSFHEIYKLLEEDMEKKDDDISRLKKEMGLSDFLIQTKMNKFINWLLDQKIPEEEKESGADWYDTEVLVDFWNIYMTTQYDGI